MDYAYFESLVALSFLGPFGTDSGFPHQASQALTVPEHYTKGADVLRITPEIDKSRWGRDVPLTEKARNARLGLSDGLKGEAAKRFAGSHLRSAMTTHEPEQRKNVGT